MFTARLTNFGTARDFATIEAAQDWLSLTAFEGAVFDAAGVMLQTFSPIGGWRPAGWSPESARRRGGGTFGS